MRREVRSLALAATTLFVLSGCGKDDSSVTDTTYNDRLACLAARQELEGARSALGEAVQQFSRNPSDEASSKVYSKLSSHERAAIRYGHHCRL